MSDGKSAVEKSRRGERECAWAGEGLRQITVPLSRALKRQVSVGIWMEQHPRQRTAFANCRGRNMCGTFQERQRGKWDPSNRAWQGMRPERPARGRTYGLHGQQWDLSEEGSLEGSEQWGHMNWLCHRRWTRYEWGWSVESWEKPLAISLVAPTRMVTNGQTVGYILKVESTCFPDGLIRRGHLCMDTREESWMTKAAGQNKKGFAIHRAGAASVCDSAKTKLIF